MWHCKSFRRIPLCASSAQLLLLFMDISLLVYEIYICMYILLSKNLKPLILSASAWRSLFIYSKKQQIFTA